MFILIMILALAGVYVEIKAVQAMPLLGRLLERYRLLALAFSLVLSVILGDLFGAAGLIVFASGIFSTILVQPYYIMRKNGMMAKITARVAHVKSEYALRRDLYLKRWRLTMRAVTMAWRVLMAPFRVVMAIMDKFS